jgi:hypothetical protein
VQVVILYISFKIIEETVLRLVLHCAQVRVPTHVAALLVTHRWLVFHEVHVYLWLGSSYS